MDGLISYVQKQINEGVFSEHMGRTLLDFIESYLSVVSPDKRDHGRRLVSDWLQFVTGQIKSPFEFPIFHEAIRRPFDFYRFGLEFMQLLIDFEHSKTIGIGQLETIRKQLQGGENVIFLANHQIEPDPQVISLLIKDNYPEIAENMIFVAGHRVTTDPMAVPMSLGRNLLCIYSKKYMEFSPEDKSEKVARNQKTMKKMQELLADGGRCIYVAPSGGRDRPNAEGLIEVADFDPDSLELFRLIAKGSKRTTHFYPLALKTYDLMPPPDRVEKELGEERKVGYSSVGLAFGPEVDMESFPGAEGLDKQDLKQARARFVEGWVKEAYASFGI